MSFLREALKSAARRCGALPLLRLAAAESATRALGWHRSALEEAPVDAAGQPVPWMTYACVHFLGLRLRPEMRLFEFGGGGSTRWFAARCTHVTTLEHDPAWVARLRPSLPANVSLHCQPVDDPRPYGELAFGQTGEGGPYVDFIASAGGPWNVIVIDGILRNACVRAALPHLAPDGVLVVDNSDYPELRPGLERLRAEGFRQIPFQGLAPVQSALSETSIFYRPDNCLGL